MANTKTGLNYYTIDTDRYQDRRIKRLKKDLGCKGIAVYDYIICEIYRVRGCFLEWDDNTVFDVAEYFGLEENTVQEVVKYCGSVGLFDKALLSRGVITSASIQHRYIDMCSRAKRKAASIPEAYAITQTDEEPPSKETPERGVCQEQPPRNEPNSLDEEVEALKGDDSWLDQLQVLHHLDKSALRTKLDEFKLQCAADGKLHHQSLQDAKHHYNSWLRIVLQSTQKKNNEENQSRGRAQRRGNLLSPQKEKAYTDTF